MKRNLLISFFCLLCLWVSAAEKVDFDKAVRTAVERQMQFYPKSTLKDLYKNFFQDKFGPGHIISDTTAEIICAVKWLLIRKQKVNWQSRRVGKVTSTG